ncbi:MAG: hypothetical protein Q7V58_03690 [Actinomycetota bacterium]|nr:hypothetical protein [Actinomycetota bacterium]
MPTGDRSRRFIGLLAAAALVTGAMTLASAPLTRARDELVPDHVVTTWTSIGDPQVVVTKAGATYTGTVLRAFSLPNQHRCEYQPGQVIWTMQWSRDVTTVHPTYSGMALVFDNRTCAAALEPAAFLLGEAVGPQLTLHVGPRVMSEDSWSQYSMTAEWPRMGDLTPPVVHVKKLPGKTDTSARVQFWVKDNSRKARLTWTLYSDGTAARHGGGSALQQATGTTQVTTVKAVNGFPGPYYVCLGAEDANGNKSRAWPNSSCAWVPLLVDLADSPVINGCGGSQWGATAGEVQALVLDVRTYGSTVVRFAEACNIHDAGYAGITVHDPVSGDVIDFRKWTRESVDELFLEDLRALCVRRLAGRESAALVRECKNGDPVAQALLMVGAAPPIGALTYFTAVRTFAVDAYDTNATLPGTQTNNRPTTWPTGGRRDNG